MNRNSRNITLGEAGASLAPVFLQFACLFCNSRVTNQGEDCYNRSASPKTIAGRRKIQKYAQLIGEILGQIYRDKHLYRCLCDSVSVRPERLRILYQVVMNYERMSPQAIREKVYHYGQLIEDEELLARQMFLWLMRLLESIEHS